MTLEDCTAGPYRFALVLTGGPSLYSELGKLVGSIDEYIQPASCFEMDHNIVAQDLSKSSTG